MALQQISLLLEKWAKKNISQTLNKQSPILLQAYPIIRFDNTVPVAEFLDERGAGEDTTLSQLCSLILDGIQEKKERQGEQE